jgi:hypothetical protein
MAALREFVSAMRHWRCGGCGSDCDINNGGESGGKVRAAVKAARNAIPTAAAATAVAAAMATAAARWWFGGGSGGGGNNDGSGQRTSTTQHTPISPSPSCKVFILSRFPLISDRTKNASGHCRRCPWFLFCAVSLSFFFGLAQELVMRLFFACITFVT